MGLVVVFRMRLGMSRDMVLKDLKKGERATPLVGGQERRGKKG